MTKIKDMFKVFFKKLHKAYNNNKLKLHTLTWIHQVNFVKAAKQY